MVVNSFHEWIPPKRDTLVLDYSSTQLPPKGAKIIESSFFEKLLQTMRDDSSESIVKVGVLRSLSHLVYIDSMQMRMLMGYFGKSKDRTEVFVTFFNRLVEVHNSKLYRVQFYSYDQIQAIQKRVGFARSFPYIQPENAKIELDLKYHDQRIVLSVLAFIQARENTGNIRDPEYVRIDGSYFNFEMGIPRSWENLDRVPVGGKFSCVYACSSDYRNLEARKKMCYMYTYVDCNVKEDDIQWCTGLNEAPPVIIEFLLFLISTCNADLDKAFTKIDGGGGSGTDISLTLRELREGLLELGWEEQKGELQQETIETIFRYLDPGGEGSVSVDEWDVLHQLWAEAELSIKEFVQFLVRTFGDNLETAWSELDCYDENEIGPERFEECVLELGYFGPVSVVFDLLDETDDGSISIDEFLKLQKYVVPR